MIGNKQKCQEQKHFDLECTRQACLPRVVRPFFDNHSMLELFFLYFQKNICVFCSSHITNLIKADFV